MNHKTAFSLLVLFLAAATGAHAAVEQHSFAGGGLGFEVLSQNGSGSGIYLQGQAGYNFDSALGLGLHAGYSKVGTVAIRTLDFGAFGQLTDADSGFYGRLYLDGVNASVDGGGTHHGVAGTQTGFAPGVALGLLIPPAGHFHMSPEVGYRLALLDSTVNLIVGTFNLVWDF